MKDVIKIFNNAEFGQIRTSVTESGEPLFCLADVCKALGLVAKEVNRRLEKDEVVSTHPIVDRLGRTQQALFVNEDGLYDVILDSRKPEAKAFRKWITKEVLPSIRKTGGYIIEKENDTPEEIMARALKIAQDTLDRREERIKALEYSNNQQRALIERKSQQLDESMEWYSIKRWAQLHHKNWRSYSWRKLKALSFELGYTVKKIFDANYGEVNIYNKNVFDTYEAS